MGTRAMIRGRKASFELSAEMIVVLIISIAILGMGIMLVRKFYSSAGEEVLVIDQQAKNQLFNLLDRGGRVANPFKRMEDAERGKIAVFGIGVRNLLNEVEAFEVTDFNSGAPSQRLSGGNRFRINVTASLVPPGVTLAEAQDKIRVVNTAQWIPDPKPLSEDDRYIPNNDKDIVAVGYAVPRNAPSGTYVFNVDISYVNSTHNGPLNISYHRYATQEKLYLVLE